MPADDYEYAVPTTVGGAAGTFTLSSPWGPGPAEYCVRFLSFTAAGGVAITPDLSTPAVGATTATNSSGRTGELIYSPVAGGQALTPSGLFALAPTGVLTITLTGASNTLLTVHWRRRLQFARMPDAYVINPDTTPAGMLHEQRARDIAAGLAAQTNDSNQRGGR